MRGLHSMTPSQERKAMTGSTLRYNEDKAFVDFEHDKQRSKYSALRPPSNPFQAFGHFGDG